MRKLGRRDNDCQQRQVVPYLEISRQVSSSTLDQTDTEILLLTENRPVTILNISEKLSLPFVECLLRIRALCRLNLLARAEGEPDDVGLHRYSSAIKHEQNNLPNDEMGVTKLD